MSGELVTLAGVTLLPPSWGDPGPRAGVGYNPFCDCPCTMAGGTLAPELSYPHRGGVGINKSMTDIYLPSLISL